VSAELTTAARPVVRVGTAETTDGGHLHWRADGEGPLALVASNGIGVSTFFWRKLASHFSSTHTFITWDYRGHGQSPVPSNPENLTVALCARDLWAVVTRAGFERAVLLGHSMGSQVILEAYRQHAERVQAMVPLLGTAGKVFSSFLGGPALEPLIRLLVEVGAANAQLAEQGLRAVLRVPGVWEAVKALGVVHPDLCPREDFEPYFEHLSQLDLRGYFALARDLLSHDASDLLPQIKVPVLVVAGERDLFTPLARSREMAAAIPGAELLVLREGSHAAMVEQPELLALTLEKFLRAHGLWPGTSAHGKV
jgi:pimeloyl-ACP methyl ester carboxylesterase